MLRSCVPMMGVLCLLGGEPGTARAAERQGPAPACDEGQRAQPATPPAAGRDSGTAPGGMGSTGWSGGTGGSHIGTSPSGGTPATPEPQPPTVQGVNPPTAPGSNTPPERRPC